MGEESRHLLSGVRDITVSDPTVHFKELGLILERKLVIDGVSHYGLPLKKLITFWLKTAWDKPFSSNVCVDLDSVGIPIIGDNLDSEVRKRN